MIYSQNISFTVLFGMYVRISSDISFALPLAEKKRSPRSIFSLVVRRLSFVESPASITYFQPVDAKVGFSTKDHDELIDDKLTPSSSHISLVGSFAALLTFISSVLVA
jgi:hypothetical protein